MEVKVKNLTVKFDSRVILNNLNFVVQPGEIAAIIGPNGSGKTTLFRAILGLINYQGEININSRSVKDHLNQIGYVPQYFDFDRTIPITVKEFLNFFIRTKEEHKNLKNLFDNWGLTKFKNSLIGRLSGGQLQKVLIVSSLIKQPKLLLLDEAAAGIDIEASQDFYELIKKLNQQGVTVMMISHELNLVYRFVDKIICLNRDLICLGTPKEVITDNTLRRLYGEEVGPRKHRHH